jgi:uncharacterized membrane protein
MTSLASRYLTALVVLVVLDALWLSYFVPAIFRPTLRPILLDEPRWLAAGLFYACYAVGVAVFAVAPATRQNSLLAAAANGALLGFIAYMTYDFTNLASLKAWTPALAAIDIAWGTIATSAAAIASCEVGMFLAGRE